MEISATAHAIVDQALKQTMRPTAISAAARYLEFSSPLGNYLEGDQLDQFVKHLSVALTVNGDEPSSLQFLCDRGLEPLLQSPIQLILRFIQKRLNHVAFATRVKAQDPVALGVLRGIACPCCENNAHTDKLPIPSTFN